MESQTCKFNALIFLASQSVSFSDIYWSTVFQECQKKKKKGGAGGEEAWMGLMYCKYCQSEASKNHKAVLKTKDCLLCILVTLLFRCTQTTHLIFLPDAHRMGKCRFVVTAAELLMLLVRSGSQNTMKNKILRCSHSYLTC